MENNEANARKDKILQLHHNLRNPLNSVLGFIQIIIEDEELSLEDKKGYFEILKNKTNEFMNDIDQIIELFLKMESN